MTVDQRTDAELMAEFEQKSKEAKEANKQFDNFYFFLHEDEKAVVHPLLNVPQLTLTEILYHEKFDRQQGKMVADCVCAASFGKQCKLCQEAEFTADKKLKASPRLFLPVYLHGVYKTGLTGEVEAVMQKCEDGVERRISGIRFLKLKLGSAILDSLKEFYYDSEDRSILTSDFVITRRGSGLDTTYQLTSRKLTPISVAVAKYSAEKVVSDVRVAREEQAIEAPEVDPFVPADEPMTVAETLASKPPTEKQLKEITFFCDLLGKDTNWKPLNYAQADNMLRNLREEHAKSEAEEEEDALEQREVRREKGVPIR